LPSWVLNGTAKPLAAKKEKGTGSKEKSSPGQRKCREIVFREGWRLRDSEREFANVPLGERCSTEKKERKKTFAWKKRSKKRRKRKRKSESFSLKGEGKMGYLHAYL